jgi:hypothetical protein
VKHRLPRPSPALVVSCLALLVALGGTGYAAGVANLPRSSVGTTQLKRNAVTASKIAPNAVRAGHVLNGSLLAEDFKAGQLPKGEKGDKGDKGDRGDPGPTEGVSAVDASPAPPASLTNQFGGSGDLAATFTTTRAGKLFLTKSLSARLGCAASSAAWWWLTLDGATVTGSLRLVSVAATLDQMTLDGVTAQSVPAGQHTLGVAAMCFTGAASGGGWVIYSGGNAVVLG